MKNKLGMKIKLGYGICDLGGNLFFTIMGFYLLFFLTDTIKLSAGLAGIALLIGKLWDGITDPAVGYLSDRTVTKWGRRRPYIFIGSFLLFIFMILMFTNPGSKDQVFLFIWASVIYSLLCTAYTLVNIPYGALTPELTEDFNERTVLNGYRMIFAATGTLLGAVLVPFILSAFGDGNTAWTIMGGIMGGVMAGTALVTFFTVKENPRIEKIEHKNIIKSYLEVLKLKPFLLALFPWALHITGVTVIQGAVIYYFTYIYEDAGAFQIALAILILSSMLFIPVWVRISAKIGKKMSYNIGMLIFAFSVLMFFFFGEILGVKFAFAVMFIAGIGFATQYVMPYSIIPDVIEYDYAENGVKREGIFYGLWTLVSKIGQAFALAFVGWILTAFKYQPPSADGVEAVQSAFTKLGIKLLCGPVPALFFITGVVILSFYPINRQYYTELLEKIKSREARD